MPQRSATAPFTIVSIDPTRSTPLFRQLYDGLRAAILSGQLAAGVRIPSTRALARELGLSRHMVLTAFELLRHEGYVAGKPGAGTYIARIRPTPMDSSGSDSGTIMSTLSNQAHPWSRMRSRWSMALGAITASSMQIRRQAGAEQVAFRVGLPGLDVFPYALWARLLTRHWQRSARHLLGYDDPLGYRPLREAIAGYLGATRGIACTPRAGGDCVWNTASPQPRGAGPA